MYPVALTGAIGSGKTTVASLFNKSYNIDIICADQCAKEVILLPEVITSIIDKFGDSILNADGIIDRKSLRSAISHNSSARLFLNNLMHPIIRQSIESKLIKSQSVYTIVDIPLLRLETLDNYPYLQKIISVFASIERKLARITMRDNENRSQAFLILQSQISDNNRRQFSDFVIENDETMIALNPKINKINQTLCAFVKK